MTEESAAVDRADIEAALAGNKDAFRSLAERYKNLIARRMRRFAREPAHVHELTHEVLVQAYLSLPTYRYKAPFEHWLMKIATAVGYSYWKKKSREQAVRTVPVEECYNLASKEPEGIDPERASEALHELMDRLPPRDRLVLTLRYIEGHSVEETAQLTGWSKSMVKVQTWRAVRKLKALFRDAGLEQG